MSRNISTAFKRSEVDGQISKHLLTFEDQASPEAIRYFAQHCEKLTNYGYWFLLSTLWVWAGDVTDDLDLWRKLFSSNRPDKEISLMKRDELREFKSLPNKVTVYRAMVPNESDGISYTTSIETVFKFARRHGSQFILTGRIKKHDITALFLRRGENEILILNRKLIRELKQIPIITQDILEADK
ncbi:hypothetical protein [Lentilactobacillus buchneri]|uniref:hypothetical protein n=1 Tax=Lentilactobacillus buchneri TaxID=1581 RepID=UPI0021A6D2F1|nr:hypothetical protein [Lentilactobacillus buchneri]MCT2882934.1 hypothetical protein [Lentilactobacillus buchneri]